MIREATGLVGRLRVEDAVHGLFVLALHLPGLDIFKKSTVRDAISFEPLVSHILVEGFHSLRSPNGKPRTTVRCITNDLPGRPSNTLPGRSS
jgi:hypothetical protein